jgi:uncharacterized membrane protein
MSSNESDDQISPPNARWLDRLLDPSRVVARVEDEAIPAWRRVTRGEARGPVTAAIVAAIALQVVLPGRVGNRPVWLLPTIALLLLVGIVSVNPTRINRRSRVLRAASLALIAVMSAANMASAVRLVVDLLRSEGIRDPTKLLLTGGAIWLANIIVFALWYWEFDRGGPVARALAVRDFPDFLFPQMTSPELAPPHWEPDFVGYFYLSFTNAAAFSPTDVMPLSRWAKLTMLAQSLASLMLAVLVIARAVNVLR